MSHLGHRRSDKAETLVTIDEMTFLREVTEPDFCNCMCLISSLIQSVYFLVCLK